MKRIHRLCLAAAVMTLVVTSVGAQSARADQGTATVTATALYLRSQPSTGSSALACAENGDSVLVTDSQDGWYQVIYNGQSGYMCADYLSLGNDSSGSTSGTSYGTATVTGNLVRLRSGPSTDNQALTELNKGDTVTITGVSGDWYAVNWNGTDGYILGTYLSVGATSSAAAADTETAAVTATPAPTAAAETTTDTAAADTTAATGSTTGIINASYVRFRATPSTSGKILGVFFKGDNVTVSDTSNGWCAVSYNGTSGYVFAQYVSTGDSAAAVTTTDTTTTASDTTGTISGTYVRFRAAASTSSSVLGTFNKGDTVTITGTTGDWYSVTYNGTAGYVYAVYVSTGSTSTDNSTAASTDSNGTETLNVTEQSATDAWVVSAVHFRTGPDSSYSSLAVLSANTQVTITGYTEKWYQVSYNDKTGYIFKTYLTTTEPSSTTTTTTSTTTSSTKGDAIVATAKTYLGVPYVYGGTSPSGFDCSGFVYYVYRQNGYTITRTATSQNRDGTSVSRSNLQPGDIIIFYNSAKTGIGHSGIYIGNNQFIHASSGSGRVIISSLSETYYNTRFYAARRIIN